MMMMIRSKRLMGRILAMSLMMAGTAQIAGAATIVLNLGESQEIGGVLVSCGGAAAPAQPTVSCECRSDDAYNNAVHIPDYAYKLYEVTSYPDGRTNSVLLADTDYIGGQTCESAKANFPACR